MSGSRTEGGESHGFGRLEAAGQIISAYTTIARWASRDFKRARVPAELTSTQFAILAHVDQLQRLTVSQLADRLDLTVPTVVRAVDALQRKRLVVRQRSVEDQREVMIAATPEGKRVRLELERARQERLARLLRRMSDEEVGALLVGYDALARAALEDQGEERQVV